MKQRRFDIAGAHPDEVYRAVADVHTAVKEIGQQLGGTWFSQLPEANDKILLWLANRPLRHGDNLDADVQQHLAMGGRIMDGLEVVLPLGLSKSQAEMRGRCHELAGSMEKVLQKRLQEASRQGVALRQGQRDAGHSETAGAEGVAGRQDRGGGEGHSAQPLRQRVEGRHCPEDLSSLGAERGGAFRKNRDVSANAGRGAVVACLHAAGRSRAAAQRAERRALGACRSQ